MKGLYLVSISNGLTPTIEASPSIRSNGEPIFNIDWNIPLALSANLKLAMALVTTLLFKSLMESFVSSSFKSFCSNAESLSMN